MEVIGVMSRTEEWSSKVKFCLKWSSRKQEQTYFLKQPHYKEKERIDTAIGLSCILVCLFLKWENCGFSL